MCRHYYIYTTVVVKYYVGTLKTLYLCVIILRKVSNDPKSKCYQNKLLFSKIINHLRQLVHFVLRCTRKA